MEEEDKTPKISFVPCVKWIRRGVAKNHPVKVVLTKEELEQVIKGAQNSLTIDGDDDDDDENEQGDADISEQADPADEYNMANYDEEAVRPAIGVGDIAVYDEDLARDEPDSDDENDIIKPEDHLLVAGRVEDDSSVLEVYVYNQEEGSMYVHQDIPLASIPLALEWLNYDPENVNKPGNMMAVGMMSPIIEVWDLDIFSALEPAFKLGRKGSRAKGRARVGHKDAVLDLSWNTNFSHVLASGGVDKTVHLWDLESQEPSQSMNLFRAEVQTLEWHPREGQTLLTGDKSGACCVWDCRSESSCKTWTMSSGVERVLWNHTEPFLFLSSDETGQVHCYDCRQDAPVWTLQAHAKGVSGLSLSTQCPGLLLTGSEDQTLKVWDVTGSQQILVYTKALRIGDIHCLEAAPDRPFLYASGGNQAKHNIKVFNLRDEESVRTRFGGRELAPPVPIEGAGEPQPSSSNGTPTLFCKGSMEKKMKKSPLLVRKKKKKFKKERK